MKKLISFLVLLCFSSFLNAQTIFGVWESRNGKTDKVDSYVKVYKKDGKAYAKIIKITDKNRQDIVCDLCEGKEKDKPILGMNILTGLEKDDDEWSGGTILDPRSGKIYKCYIKLVTKDKLKIRGYIGVSLFGKTAYWYRKK